MLKAINIIKEKLNFCLLIVGYGKKKSFLLNYIQKNNLNKSVKILPYQHNPYNLIKLSDIFILTSIYEGLPNVLLEAQVLKKFIISSDCPTGPREILLNGKAGYLFKMRDYKNLAELIIKASKNIKTLTEVEGFDAHYKSIDVRLK